MSENKNPIAEMWDARYAEAEFAYGISPNQYFQSKISSLAPGKLLLPAEGEGRNAAFALSLGWNVEAFDLSIEGKRKAEKLAEGKSGKLNYSVANALEIEFPEARFDAVLFCYAHFPSEQRNLVYQKMLRAVKPGGHIILEGFGKQQLEYQKHQKSGGPREADFLFDLAELKALFNGLEILEMLEGEVKLEEGKYHQGQAWVCRFFGRK